MKTSTYHSSKESNSPINLVTWFHQAHGRRLASLLDVTGFAIIFYSCYPLFFTEYTPEPFVIITSMVTILAFTELLQLFGGYDFRYFTSTVKHASAILSATLITASLITIAWFLSVLIGAETSIYSWLFFALCLSFAWTCIFHAFIIVQCTGRRWRTLFSKRAAIICQRTQAASLYNSFANNASAKYALLGLFTFEQTQPEKSLPPYIKGDLETLIEAIMNDQIDTIIFSSSYLKNESKEFLDTMNSLAVELVIYDERKGNQEKMEQQNLIPILELLISGPSLILKDLIDRFISLYAIIGFSPFLMLIALIIRCESKGPIIFKQERGGINDQTFNIYKFRTMVYNQPHTRGVEQAKPNDHRITRFGMFLRRTSLDEIPQLFNVLQGNMSLVGPRPHAVIHNKKYKGYGIYYYDRRCRVKPGITGWAQVNGLRGMTLTVDDMRSRIDFDIEYIDYWTFPFDLKILVKTIAVVAKGENAY